MQICCYSRIDRNGPEAEMVSNAIDGGLPFDGDPILFKEPFIGGSGKQPDILLVWPTKKALDLAGTKTWGDCEHIKNWLLGFDKEIFVWTHHHFYLLQLLKTKPLLLDEIRKISFWGPSLLNRKINNLLDSNRIYKKGKYYALKRNAWVIETVVSIEAKTSINRKLSDQVVSNSMRYHQSWALVPARKKQTHNFENVWEFHGIGLIYWHKESRSAVIRHTAKHRTGSNGYPIWIANEMTIGCLTAGWSRP